MSLTRVSVVGKRDGSGVMVDSAPVVGPKTAWRYVASRGVRMNDIRVEACEMGIHLLARPTTGDPRFSDFDVSLANATLRNCSNWSVRAESATSDRVTGFNLFGCTVEATSKSGGNGGVGYANAVGMVLDALKVTHSSAQTLFSATGSVGFVVDRLELSITGASKDAAPPCALFVNSDGVIDELKVSWLHAPITWTPVRVTIAARPDDAVCAHPSRPSPVVVKTFSIEPSLVRNRVELC